MENVKKQLGPQNYFAVTGKMRLKMRDPLIDIMEERYRQDNKWGEQNHGDLYWLGILMEEVGEVAKAIIEGDQQGETKVELIQVTAVALAWLECISRREQKRKR